MGRERECTVGDAEVGAGHMHIHLNKGFVKEGGRKPGKRMDLCLGRLLNGHPGTMALIYQTADRILPNA